MSVDHLALMRSRLISQFKGLPVLDAFLHGLGDQLNDVEEALGQLMTQLILPNAIGVQLDKLGDALNQSRNGLGDGDYRTLLQARVVAYQSQGTVENLIQILLTIGGAQQVQVLEGTPAAMQISAANLGTDVTHSDIVTSVFEAKAAGVGLNLVANSTKPVFQYDNPASANNAGYDVGHVAGPLI